MLTNFFKSQQPLSLIIIPVVTFLIWLIKGHQQMEVVSTNGGPLYALVLYLLQGKHAAVYASLGALMMSGQAIHLSLITNKHEVLYKSSYLPSLLYLLLGCCAPQFIVFHPMLFANSIMILTLDKIFRLYKNPDAKGLDFDICFLISTAALFYLPFLIFLLLFATGVAILKPFAWRDWVIGIIGLCLPFFFLFVYYFLTDTAQLYFSDLILQTMQARIKVQNIYPHGFGVSLSFIVFLFIITVLKLVPNFYKNVIKTRNFQQIIFGFLIVSLASVAVSSEILLYRFSIAAVPLAVIISYYFLAIKKTWISEILLYLLIGTIAYNYISV